jgi:small-conductance mechanosensitive channel
MYDRQLEELDQIDDSALRILRTNIIILGFVAAALTAGGPDAVSDLRLTTVAFGYFGCAGLVASAFVSVGTFVVTEYPNEVRTEELRAAPFLEEDEFKHSAVKSLREAILEVRLEVIRNGNQLSASLMAFLLGTVCLVAATLIAILTNSYGLSQTSALAVSGVVVISLVLAVGTLGKFFNR